MRRCSPRLWLLVAGLAFGACRTGRSNVPPPRPVAGAPTKKGVTHVVQRGQTLYRIAKTYDVPVDVIAKTNHLTAETLATGAKLWIPGASRVLEVPITGLSDSPPAKAPEPTKTPAKSTKPAVAEQAKPTAKAATADQNKPAAKAPAETPKPAAKGAADAEKGPTPEPARPPPPKEPAKPPPTKVAQKEAAAGDGDGEEDNVPAKKPDSAAEKGTSKESRFIWPVKGFVQSQFGQRGNRPHDGIDIKADKGSPIIAADAGEVIYAGTQRGYGNIVLVKHDDALITIYAHNEANSVKQGDRVKKGQVIATVGRTGRATNDHLHFEVRENRLPKNPLTFLPEE